jgi:hypothetical protein
MTLREPGKDPKFPQNLLSISLLPTTSKLFEKVTLKIAQRHIEERGLLNAVQFVSCASQGDTSVYEAYRLRNNKFRQ